MVGMYLDWLTEVNKFMPCVHCSNSKQKHNISLIFYMHTASPVRNDMNETVSVLIIAHAIHLIEGCSSSVTAESAAVTAHASQFIDTLKSAKQSLRTQNNGIQLHRS